MVGNFIGTFPLCLEFEYLVIPSFSVSGNSVHGIDSSHQGSGNSIDKVSNEDVVGFLSFYVCISSFLLEVGNIGVGIGFIGVVFLFDHFGGG